MKLIEGQEGSVICTLCGKDITEKRTHQCLTKIKQMKTISKKKLQKIANWLDVEILNQSKGFVICYKSEKICPELEEGEVIKPQEKVNHYFEIAKKRIEGEKNEYTSRLKSHG